MNNNTPLAPCPICGSQPEHFYSGKDEVIHCLKGCKLNKPFKPPNVINKEYVEHLIGFSKRESVEHVLNQLIPDNRSECWC